MPPSATSTRPQFLRSLSSTSSMKTTKDKPRVYIVLYPRGASSATSSFRSPFSCDSYHWAIVVGPSTTSRECGTRYHIAHHNEDSHRHFYEEQDVPSNSVAQKALIRVTVCKVTDEERLQSILRILPVPEEDPAFNCLSWVRDAFYRLHDDGKAVKSYLNAGDWNNVEACARKYCKRKRDAGRFQDGNATVNVNGMAADWDVKKISTFNFWENRETTP